MTDYNTLKKENLPLLSQRQGQDRDLQLSEEEMQTIQTAKYNIIKFPIFAGSAALLLTQGLKFITKPGMFENPLYPDERSIIRRKFFKQVFSKWCVFFATLGGFGWGFAKFEFTKYYMFLKHRNLVNAYLDAMEVSYLDNLQDVGQVVEQQVQEKIQQQIQQHREKLQL